MSPFIISRKEYPKKKGKRKKNTYTKLQIQIYNFFFFFFLFKSLPCIVLRSYYCHYVIFLFISQNPTFSKYHTITISHECFALGGMWIPHRRQQILAPVDSSSIVASTWGFVHQYLTRVTRISPFPKNTRTSRNRFERPVRWSLVVPVIKRVRYRSRQNRAQIDNHSVNSDVSVRRN